MQIRNIINKLTCNLVLRLLQDDACTLERGFVLSDTLNSYERISDHCSNIAIAVLEEGR